MRIVQTTSISIFTKVKDLVKSTLMSYIDEKQENFDKNEYCEVRLIYNNFWEGETMVVKPCMIIKKDQYDNIATPQAIELFILAARKVKNDFSINFQHYENNANLSECQNVADIMLLAKRNEYFAVFQTRLMNLQLLFIALENAKYYTKANVCEKDGRSAENDYLGDLPKIIRFNAMSSETVKTMLMDKYYRSFRNEMAWLDAANKIYTTRKRAINVVLKLQQEKLLNSFKDF